MKKIFLDPGHGAHDPGTSGNGLLEKDLALKIALETREILLDSYSDVAVNMSRVNDTFVELSARAAMANAWGADVFVSVHHNGGDANGFESFRHISDSSSALQNSLHVSILSHMHEEASWVIDRGAKSADFAVLRETNMPAVLTENLFLGHKASADMLKRQSFFIDIALGHAEGIVNYLNLEDADMPTADEIAYAVWNRENPGTGVKYGTMVADMYKRIKKIEKGAVEGENYSDVNGIFGQVRAIREKLENDGPE